MKSRYKNGVKETMMLAGSAAMAGTLGSAFGSSGTALVGAGEGMAAMVKPMATVSGAGMVIRHVRRLRKRR